MKEKHPEHRQALLAAFFLPDLCNTRAVVALLLLSETLVMALTLVEGGLADFSWQRFATVSLFVQWVSLLSVALLCQSRIILVKLSVLLASVAAMLLIQLVTLFVSVLGETLLSTEAMMDWHWVLRNQMVAAIFSMMALRYFYVQSQWRLKTQAELHARLAALQANIRPHFLFNTLNTVASLIAIDPDKAERLLVDLSQLFRAVLRSDGQKVPLAEEIQLGQRYLMIEAIRLGERLQVDWQLPETLPDMEVPQLLLQPLLENAVYHGIQPMVEGGQITVTLEQLNQEWCLGIVNSKPDKASSTAGNHMAHNNIRARLEALSDTAGSAARLIVDDKGDSYIARLYFPQSFVSGQEKE